jgi:hypothetical protein
MEDKRVFTTCEDSTVVEYKNTIVIASLSLIILALLGINVCGILSNAVDFVSNVFSPIVRNVLDVFGYSIGSALKHTAEDVKQGAKTGVDIVGDTVEDAGDLIMAQTKEHFTVLDNIINTAPESMINREPMMMNASSPIQLLSR